MHGIVSERTMMKDVKTLTVIPRKDRSWERPKTKAIRRTRHAGLNGIEVAKDTTNDAESITKRKITLLTPRLSAHIVVITTADAIIEAYLQTQTEIEDPDTIIETPHAHARQNPSTAPTTAA
ncbi:MAG: hypothetical protein Q9188_007661, partial [Gyalolechia gomerana]